MKSLSEEQERVVACISYLSKFYDIKEDDIISFIVVKLLQRIPIKKGGEE